MPDWGLTAQGFRLCNAVFSQSAEEPILLLHGVFQAEAVGVETAHGSASGKRSAASVAHGLREKWVCHDYFCRLALSSFSSSAIKSSSSVLGVRHDTSATKFFQPYCSIKESLSEKDINRRYKSCIMAIERSDSQRFITIYPEDFYSASTYSRTV